MAKQTTDTLDKPTVVPADSATVVRLETGDVNVAALLKEMKTAKAGIELVSEYYKFQVGEVVRAIVLGVKKMPKINGKEGETVNAIKMLTSEGQWIITADVVLVSTLLDAAISFDEHKTKAMVEIKCTGESAGSVAGTYKTFSVKTL